MTESGGGGKKLQCNKGWNYLQGYKKQVEEQVSEVKDRTNLAHDILRVACCVLGAYGDNPKGGGGCDLLYYVLGSMVYSVLGEGLFDTIMNKLYPLLGNILGDGKCSEWNHRSGKELFKLMDNLSYYNLAQDSTLGQPEESGKISCERYTNYLKDLGRACAEVKEYCAESQNKSMCDGIPLEQGEQGSPDYLLGLIYGIIPELEATLEAEMTQEKQECLKDLPSDMKHRTLNDIKNQCNGGNHYTLGKMKGILRGVLDESWSAGKCANQIIRGVCSARATEESSSSSGERCIPLYYYIGGVISTVPGSVNNFSALMKATYDELVKFGINNQCTNLYQEDNIDKTTFDNMKLIYDYTRDHEIIKQYVKNPWGAGFSCTEYYSKYVQQAYRAYHYMEQKCPQLEDTESSDKKWCNDLKSTLAQHKKEELLKLESSLKNISPPSTTDSTAAVTTGSAVGGTLFGIGLPALGAFLSYKYDLLPSGIRKFFLRGGSGTRMRRSAFGPNSDAEMENFTEYYTENGLTTIDPTEYSTVAGSSSNLTTTSTEDSSILYNDDGPSRSPPSPPPSRKRRGGGNNRRDQNISYHSMER
ncbi:KIR protein [Plasmodium knowlesi strain H]|uniref:KIR protein n=3 Tax=Plasmodium knowlesi TaxID=5850 RepID=A0A5K1V5I4_PLAKH|nr:KIR protein [Plasmodium knowlesi strain H]OTN63706.1 KIR protein [Plasmodium knowlesi]CAA9991206.1 KIR protein [Plasmodium knowlesi strain H]SBO26266.1 KIR protein [Plasmodium knowlesi strain H]SBO29593.1 KIR protein [Plasmodium knowlesi strain H]VVS80680.1 KIR protein [Plasmodium knowlesi strain H]|eukprot:XP_002262489.1 KIR protein [Plasmodium knowlesi strain H]